MSEIKYDKKALLEELKNVMEKSKPEEGIDITIEDIQELFGVTYNIARGFLNKIAKEGILKRIKLPNRCVVYRDVDGQGIRRAREYILSKLE